MILRNSRGSDFKKEACLRVGACHAGQIREEGVRIARFEEVHRERQGVGVRAARRASGWPCPLLEFLRAGRQICFSGLADTGQQCMPAFCGSCSTAGEWDC